MRRALIALAPLAVLVAAAAPADAGAAQVTHLSVRQEAASAFFTSIDASGCVTTNVGLVAADAVVKQAGAPTTGPQASIGILEFDGCTGTTLLSAFAVAPLARGEFQIDRRLSTASLHATVTATDIDTGTSFPVGLTISWIGVGDVFPTSSRDVFKSPGFTLKTSFSGTSRSAVATGSVSDGTTDLTPEPALFAQLDAVRFGEMTIVH